MRAMTCPVPSGPPETVERISVPWSRGSYAGRNRHLSEFLGQDCQVPLPEQVGAPRDVPAFTDEGTAEHVLRYKAEELIRPLARLAALDEIEFT